MFVTERDSWIESYLEVTPDVYGILEASIHIARLPMNLELLKQTNARLKLFGNARKLRGIRWPDISTLHVCYHRGMTLLFTRALGYCSHISGVPFRLNATLDPSQKDQVIHLHDQGCEDVPEAPLFRGSHLIRDPRDLIVSAYYYHLKTDERWCVEPSPANDDLAPDVSYQEHLESLSLEEGLIYEMNHVSGFMIDRMCAWDYQDSRFLNVRFEDMVGTEVSAFQSIFEWYGLDAAYASSLARYLEFLSHEHIKGGKKPFRSSSAHVGPGEPVGRWKATFSDRVSEAFSARFPSALEKLGYS